MGYYHVNRVCKGKILHEFPIAEKLPQFPDKWMPTGEWIADIFPKANIEFYRSLSKFNKLVYIGCLIDLPWTMGGPSRVSGITESFLTEIASDPGYAGKSVLLHAMGVVYCFAYKYSIDMFDCFCDYDNNWMFICDVKFPPSAYNERFASLTEESWGVELSEFLTAVTGVPYDTQIEICEEMVKE